MSEPRDRQPTPQAMAEQRAEDRGGFWHHPTAVIDSGAQIGAETRIWHFTHVMAGAKVGRRCMIGQGCFVAGGAVVGHGVRLQNNVSVFDGVHLEDDVFCGPSAVFTNVLNPRSAISRKHELSATHVEHGASLGANVTVVCGTRIGRYAMIGAGSVVTRDVPAFGLWVGNPARPTGWVSRHGHRLHFNASLATCPESGEQYRLEGEHLVPVSA